MLVWDQNNNTWKNIQIGNNLIVKNNIISSTDTKTINTFDGNFLSLTNPPTLTALDYVAPTSATLGYVAPILATLYYVAPTLATLGYVAPILATLGHVALTPYNLPPVSGTIRGGFRVGNNLSISGDILSAATFLLPINTRPHVQAWLSWSERGTVNP